MTVSEADVARYRADVIDEIIPKAEVPGFRAGRAPKKLVESRFKGSDQGSDQGDAVDGQHDPG